MYNGTYFRQTTQTETKPQRGGKEKSAMPEYLTLKTVAEALKVTTNTLYNWKAQGKIRFSKFGRTTRIERAELERFIKAAEKQSEA